MRNSMYAALTSLLLVLASLSTTQPLRGQSAAGSITEAEIRDHIFYLASDDLEGRGTGEEGYFAAARYAADQLRDSGVLPLLRGRGRSGFLLPGDSHGEDLLRPRE